MFLNEIRRWKDESTKVSVPCRGLLFLNPSSPFTYRKFNDSLRPLSGAFVFKFAHL
ncbi:hypothetical protein HMP0721_1309 [Pseudoramibacter alactolyticus ATCC 23263]|uniref:Uncharacterized protein n=1 Tax=Pseudoramibacter alactolyticus ATCC 23263 TaxID=887929 RepID=E6MH25_9FIRM|nr:hypothetical protein HMP0721_1309 [Pseudoramibacter alactolyticus ATCC 23263]